jgi:hypothetical protein
VSYIGQAHVRSTLRLRYLVLAVLVGMLIASLLAASAATASDVTVSNCAKLQPILNAAEAGEVITLAALCTVSNSGKYEGAFKLPSNVADITIEGQSGMTAGFDGTSVTGSALESRGSGLVLRNLVVENYSLKEKSAVSLTPTEGALPVIESDRFIDDTDSTSNNSAHGGALNISASNGACPYTAPLSITNSVFEGDRVTDTSTAEHNRDLGGAAYAEIRCNSGSPPIDFATLSGDTFAEDAIGTQAGGQAFGGALDLANASASGVLVSAKQTGNLFENDSITSMSPTGVYGGGGEWAPSIDLTSTGDRFVKDALPGPQGSSASSEGAGLGVITSTCSEKAPASATLADAVIAANTIGAASEGGQSAGAGIYAACKSSEPNSHFYLALNDSTVAGNQAPGGIAGIDGEDTDQLTLSNSIVSSPSGQADIGGFRTTSGGSLTSLFSDACAPGTSTSTPLPGEGNICANPQLEANGEETPSSPTIDAGANALVPAALTSDAFGHARILAGHAACGASFPAIVDMGADEFTPGALSCPPPIGPRPPVPGLTRYVGRKVTPTGLALTLSCVSTDGLGCSGEIFLTTNELLQGKKVIAVGSSTRGSVRLGQAPFALAAGATATFTAKLNPTGLQLLRHFHTISAFLLANEASPTSTPFIFLLDGVRFSEPEKHGSKKHGHKPRHPKPRH